MKESPIITLNRRLAPLGITLELLGNFPWVYIHKINGKLVEEKFQSDYGFTLGFQPIRINQEFKFTDLSTIFAVIRKYSDNQQSDE